jgi:hypothetical protein
MTTSSTPCPHGPNNDPQMCPRCRAEAAEKTNHVDPEIEAQWDRAAKELARRLRPYVQDVVCWDLARAFIRDMSAAGFRPPLRPHRPAPPPGAGSGPNSLWRTAKAAIKGKADES